MAQFQTKQKYSDLIFGSLFVNKVNLMCQHRVFAKYDPPIPLGSVGCFCCPGENLWTSLGLVFCCSNVENARPGRTFVCRSCSKWTEMS